MATILFRADGSSKIGLGHLIRIKCLMDFLVKQNPTTRCVLATRQTPEMATIFAQTPHAIEQGDPSDDQNYSSWIENLAKTYKIDIFIGDVRDGLPISCIENLRRCGIFTVAIDEPSDYRRAVDAVFYPPIPQVQEMDWTGFQGRIYSGWEYVLLREEFIDQKITADFSQPKLLLSFGGTDPEGLTSRCLELLQKLQFSGEVNVLVGPTFKYLQQLEISAKACTFKVSIYKNPAKTADVFKNCDRGLISFGVTAYELAALSVPAVFLCRSSEHLQSAEIFVRSSKSQTIGLFENLTEQSLKKALDDWLLNKKWLETSALKCHSFKGDGLFHIAKVISRHLSLKSF